MGRSRLNIGVDIDGVLANFTFGARQLLKEKFGKPDDSVIQTGWGFDTLGISKEEERWMWNEIDNRRDWWTYLAPLPDTNLVKELSKNHRVIFITNRKDAKPESKSRPIEEQSREWLEDTFGLTFGFYKPTVIISDDKGPIAKGLKLDYFIDDRPKNIEEVSTFYPECNSILRRATWNQDFEYPLEVANFNEFAREILNG